MTHFSRILVFGTLLYISLIFVETMDIMPEKPEILFYSKKYIRDPKVTFARKNRRSPYYLNIQAEILDSAGDNVTFTLVLYEHISGRYIMTPIQFEFKLCDFLYNEPFLGQMFAKQLPKNWTCPFPAGRYHFKDLLIHLEKFPYNLPFVWISYKVETRVDITAKLTTTNEILLSMQVECSIIQKTG